MAQMALQPPGRFQRALRVAEVEWRRYKRVWRGNIATAFVNPILYLGAMGLGLGTLVDRGVGDVSLGDISYAAFLAPGLLVASAMQIGAQEGSWSVMAGIKWVKSYHTALATPVEVTDLLLGNAIWVTARLLMASTAFAVVVWLFGFAPVGGLLVAVLVAVVVGLSFAIPMSAFAASVENASHLATAFRFGIVPMFLMSGAFFPIEQLPDWVAGIARSTPLYHGVELARAATLGATPDLHLATHVAVPLVWIVIGGVLATWRMRRRLVT